MFLHTVYIFHAQFISNTQHKAFISNKRKSKTIVQNIVFPSSAPLLMRCCTFFILNIFYCLIIMPSQSILELSHFLWAWSAPKPAWPPLLVVRHPVDQRRNFLFVNAQEGDTTWLPFSLIVKPAVPATILPLSEAPSRASSRIVTGTDIIPLWKFWGFSALIWENQ